MGPIRGPPYMRPHIWAPYVGPTYGPHVWGPYVGAYMEPIDLGSSAYLSFVPFLFVPIFRLLEIIDFDVESVDFKTLKTKIIGPHVA